MLRVSIDINEIPISEIHAVRVDGTQESDSVGTYEVYYVAKGTRHYVGTIEHRYGDGAVRLTELASGHVFSTLNLRDKHLPGAN